MKGSFLLASLVLPALVSLTFSLNGAFTQAAAQTSNQPPQTTDSSAYVRLAVSIHSVIRDVEKEFAPDKRTALFAVQTVADGKAIKLKGETNLPAAKQELMIRLKKANITTINDDVEVLPSAALDDKTAAVVAVAVCNLRSKPAHSAEMASQGLLGFPLKILKKMDNGWLLVQTPDDYIAWIDADALQPMNDAALKAWTSAKKIVVTADLTFTLAAADRSATRVSDVTKGNVLKLVGKNDTFFTVEYPDGQIAYLPLEYGIEWQSWTQTTKTFATEPNKLVETAKLCMGIPYLWGGTSMKGMDCSGFMRTVYLQHGILLPRDASQQALVGEPVNIDAPQGERLPMFWSTLKTGDLLFFGRKATDSTREAVTHVGMYVADGEYIHEAGKVHFNSFDAKAKNFNEARLKSLLRARRILGASNRAGIKTVEEVFAR